MAAAATTTSTVAAPSTDCPADDVFYGGDGNDTLVTHGGGGAIPAIGFDSGGGIASGEVEGEGGPHQDMYGGHGNDLFVVFEYGGNIEDPVDIWDFSIADDRDTLDIQLRDGVTVACVDDNGTDTTIAMSNGDSIVLHGLTGGAVPLTSIDDINHLSQALWAYDAVELTYEPHHLRPVVRENGRRGGA